MDKFVSGRIYYYLGEYQSACIALEEAKEKGGVESYLYLGSVYHVKKPCVNTGLFIYLSRGQELILSPGLHIVRIILQIIFHQDKSLLKIPQMLKGKRRRGELSVPWQGL